MFTQLSLNLPLKFYIYVMISTDTSVSIFLVMSPHLCKALYFLDSVVLAGHKAGAAWDKGFSTSKKSHRWCLVFIEAWCKAQNEDSHFLLLAGKPRAPGLQGTIGCRRYPGSGWKAIFVLLPSSLLPLLPYTPTTFSCDSIKTDFPMSSTG